LAKVLPRKHYLQFYRWKTDRAYRRFIRQAATETEKKALYAERCAEVDGYDLQLSELAQDRLFRQANRYKVPIPWHAKNDWEEWVDVQFLKPEPSFELRKAINTERKERREWWGFWFTLAVGLIGALTGLVSVIKS